MANMRVVAAILAIVGASALCVSVVGVGLLLSWPAKTEIGDLPSDLIGENVTMSSGSEATLCGWFVQTSGGGVTRAMI